MKCGHIKKKVKKDSHVQIETIVCQEACLVKLDCGHVCSGTCSSCFGGKIHKPCKGVCGKFLPCGHKCTYPCTETCPPCSRTCSWVCSHWHKCKKQCFEPSNECTDKCPFEWSHSICEYDCADICSVACCNERCTKRLQCGQICRGLCGKRCVGVDCNMKHLRNSIDQELNK